MDIRRSPDGVANVLDAQPILPAKLLLQLLEHAGGLGDLIRLAGQSQFLVTVDDLHAKRIPDHPQMPVGRAKEGQFLVGLFKGDAEVHEWFTVRAAGRTLALSSA